jgi:hypothetical protein
LQDERSFGVRGRLVAPVHSAHGIGDAEEDSSQNTSKCRTRKH